MPTIKIELYDETEDDYVEVELPATWEICSECRGNGRHDHPAFSNGITASEWESDWDEEERETYMRGGYDVDCESCDGSGKVRVVDMDAVSEDMKKRVEKQAQDDADDARERAAEARYCRMESGGY